MKRWSLIALFLLPLLIAAPQARAAQEVFHHFVWGVSREDVLKFETAVFYQTLDGSLYFVEDGTDKKVIRYDFQGNKLWRIREYYSELHKPNPQMVMNMLIDVSNRLKSRYGAPQKEELIWKDRTYRNYPQFYARAYGMGDLTFRTTWENDVSVITLESYYDGEFYQLGTTLQDKKTAPEAASGQEIFKTFNFNLKPQ